MENVTLNLKESLGNHSIGSMDVAVEARWVEKRRLGEMLEIMSAEKQQQAYLASTVDLVGGKVLVEEEEDSTCRSLKYGLPVSNVNSLSSSSSNVSMSHQISLASTNSGSTMSHQNSLSSNDSNYNM